MKSLETKGKIEFANPLYDVVFRYMMEDNKVAKLFLSAIIGKEIKELVFSPTEYSSKIGRENIITLMRMDFSARIVQEDGTEVLAIIELQKAKFYYQTMRFRRYLGKQYQNPQNIDKQDNPLPIYPIYILGEAFTKERIPVIRVQRGYVDAATGACISRKYPFIEALTHDATVIQVRHLKESRRTILERFLSIFDQGNKSDEKGHILALNEEGYPEHYWPVIRRLNKALQTPKIEDDMDMEDEVVHEFNKQAEAIEEANQRAEQEKQRAEQEKQRAEQEKQSKYQLIKKLSTTGMSITEIAKLAEMKEEEIEKILKG